MIVALVTVSITVSISSIGVVMCFAIGILALSCIERPQAEPSQQKQSKVEGYSLKVPPISKGPDQRQGIHWPIKAQRVWAKEKPKVDGRQVEEG